jgi:hypothetical protein
VIYYFVPDITIFGGIKVAYQFVDALNLLGVPAVIASPQGKAATWFLSHAAVVDATAAREMFRTEDIAVFSLPHDYETLRKLPGRVFYHCMGTDPLIDPILKDPSVEVLTCWKQAQEYVLSHGVNRPLDVGISISPSFSYAGEPKYERAVAYMPRRGRELCESVMNTCSSVRYIKIDGMAENEVARVMKSCSIFLATAENEWYGLPALEAMSAGCVVVSVPVLGGMEYLHDGINCRVAGLLEYTGVVAEILSPESMLLRFRLRQNAIATSKTYACTHMINRISRLLNGPLSSWRLC